MDESASQHPLEHVDTIKCYEWMLAECAAANAQRQAREDGLIATVIQISSAAILSIPGFALASESKIPSLAAAPLIYSGLAAFGAALCSALLEQHFSSLAYAKHIQVVQSYYTKASDQTEDSRSRNIVKRTRRLAYSSFALALTLSVIGLMHWGATHGT